MSQNACWQILAIAGPSLLNEELSHLGCYLHYNQNEDIWIQSGSATGEGGFGKRLKTHLERALSDRNDDDSRVYHFFPTKLSERANYFSKEGYFEYLTVYLGVGFSAECLLGCFSLVYQALLSGDMG